MLDRKNGFNFYRFSGTTELTEAEVRTVVFALEKSQEKWEQLANSEQCSVKCRSYNRFFQAQVSQIKGLIRALYPIQEEESVKDEITNEDIL